jgi:hypothetical protein
MVFGYDIAFIKIDIPVKCNVYIRPSCIAHDDYNFVGARECNLTGWGLNKFDPPESPKCLQEVFVDIIANRDCYIKWDLLGKQVTSCHVCTS